MDRTGSPETAARQPWRVLNTPQGVAVDAAGNIYVADYGNNRVRKIDTTGNINTIAGNGKFQFSGDDGPATAAGIDPFDLALDSAGDVLVVDQFNNRIRKIRAGQYDHDGRGNGFGGLRRRRRAGDRSSTERSNGHRVGRCRKHATSPTRATRWCGE